MPINNQIGLQKLKHLSRSEVPASKNFFAVAPRSLLPKEFQTKIVETLKNAGIDVKATDKEFTFKDKKHIHTALKEENLADEAMEVFADQIGHKRKLHEGKYHKPEKRAKITDEVEDGFFETAEKVEVTDVQVPRKRGKNRQVDGSEEDEAVEAVKDEPLSKKKD